MKRCPSYPGYSVDGQVIISHWRIKYLRGYRGSTSEIDHGYNYRLKPTVPPSKEYPVVRVRIDDKRVSRAIHRLITDAYLGPCPDGLQTRHLDGNPLNNDISNLCYGTPKENAQDRVRHGNHLPGEQHPSAKLTDKIVIEMRSKYVPRKYTIPMLAREYRLRPKTVAKVIFRATWKHLEALEVIPS